MRVYWSNKSLLHILITSLGLSDAIWRYSTWSTFNQVIACGLTAPSHCLNQCWLIIKGVLWHSPAGFSKIIAYQLEPTTCVRRLHFCYDDHKSLLLQNCVRNFEDVLYIISVYTTIRNGSSSKFNRLWMIIYSVFISPFVFDQNQNVLWSLPAIVGASENLPRLIELSLKRKRPRYGMWKRI